MNSPIEQIKYDNFISHLSEDEILLNLNALNIKNQTSCLFDCSNISRFSLRGPNAADFLESQNFSVPQQVNTSLESVNGEFVLRTGSEEFWVINSTLSEDMSQKLTDQQQCYPLFCQYSHAWLMLLGQAKEDIMAKVCGVDLRNHAFPLNSIVQTSVARINCIVLHHIVNKCDVFSIFCDSASSRYFWGALEDAKDEFCN